MNWKENYGSVTEALRHSDGLAVFGITLTRTVFNNTNLDPIIEGLAKIKKAGEYQSINQSIFNATRDGH